MHKTKIEWVKNPDGSQGYAWSPITGCLNHVGGMCKGGNFPCYAYRLAHGRLKNVYLANNILPSHDEPTHQDHHTDPFYIRLWPKRSYKPCYVKKSTGIFVCDMADLFGIGVPEGWQQSIFEVIKGCQQHHFYLLTKQPQNLAKFSPFPDNCWVGVTATNLQMLVEAHNWLTTIQAKVKYISLEPLLSWGDCDKQHACKLDYIFKSFGDYPHNVIDWLIIGAQTNPTVYPKIEWVREIVETADRAGIPVFLKDNLMPLIGKHGMLVKAGHIVTGLRQELPHD